MMNKLLKRLRNPAKRKQIPKNKAGWPSKELQALEKSLESEPRIKRIFEKFLQDARQRYSGALAEKTIRNIALLRLSKEIDKAVKPAGSKTVK